jgi:hypothetical protein
MSDPTTTSAAPLVNPTVSDYDSRLVLVEVTGLYRQDMLRTGTYRTKVPYYRLSQTIQSINRRGGKIVSVTVLSASSLSTSLPSSVSPVRESISEASTLITASVSVPAVEMAELVQPASSQLESDQAPDELTQSSPSSRKPQSNPLLRLTRFFRCLTRKNYSEG